MKENDDVELVLDGKSVASFLVPAVAQVSRLTYQGDREVRSFLVAKRNFHGRVVAEVVTHDDFRDPAPEVLGNSI